MKLSANNNNSYFFVILTAGLLFLAVTSTALPLFTGLGGVFSGDAAQRYFAGRFGDSFLASLAARLRGVASGRRRQPPPPPPPPPQPAAPSAVTVVPRFIGSVAPAASVPQVPQQPLFPRFVEGVVDRAGSTRRGTGGSSTIFQTAPGTTAVTTTAAAPPAEAARFGISRPLFRDAVPPQTKMDATEVVSAVKPDDLNYDYYSPQVNEDDNETDNLSNSLQEFEYYDDDYASNQV